MNSLVNLKHCNPQVVASKRDFAEGGGAYSNSGHREALRLVFGWFFQRVRVFQQCADESRNASSFRFQLRKQNHVADAFLAGERQAPGSARAPRAVFRALAEHTGVRMKWTLWISPRRTPTREGAGRNTRGACAPRGTLEDFDGG